VLDFTIRYRRRKSGTIGSRCCCRYVGARSGRFRLRRCTTRRSATSSPGQSTWPTSTTRSDSLAGNIGNIPASHSSALSSSVGRGTVVCCLQTQEYSLRGVGAGRSPVATWNFFPYKLVDHFLHHCPLNSPSFCT